MKPRHLASAGYARAEGDTTKVLRLWADFPVDASPRPLVLAGPDVHGPWRGFPDGLAKMAFLSGSFELVTALPAGPATVDGQPVMSAAQALARLRSESAELTAPPLSITGAELGTAEF